MSQVIEPQRVPRRKAPATAIPLLENGDHLDQKTFHERYEAMPETFKAELIQGRVYVPSPVRRTNGRPHYLINNWLGRYEASTPGVEGLNDTTAILNDENEPQPDCFLVVRPDHGGQMRLDEDEYYHGAPELAIEVAASTEAIDLFEKREAYEQAGVQEYVVVIVRTQEVRWLRLSDGNYTDVPMNDDGVFRSQVFPGLWLNPQALFAGQLQQLIASLDEGLATEGHQAFVQQLARQKSSGTQ